MQAHTIEKIRHVAVAVAWLAAIATPLDRAPWPEPPAHVGAVLLGGLIAVTAAVLVRRWTAGAQFYAAMRVGRHVERERAGAAANN